MKLNEVVYGMITGKYKQHDKFYTEAGVCFIDDIGVLKWENTNKPVEIVINDILTFTKITNIKTWED